MEASIFFYKVLIACIPKMNHSHGQNFNWRYAKNIYWIVVYITAALDISIARSTIAYHGGMSATQFGTVHGEQMSWDVSRQAVLAILNVMSLQYVS